VDAAIQPSDPEPESVEDDPKLRVFTAVGDDPYAFEGAGTIAARASADGRGSDHRETGVRDPPGPAPSRADPAQAGEGERGRGRLPVRRTQIDAATAPGVNTRINTHWEEQRRREAERRGRRRREARRRRRHSNAQRDRSVRMAERDGLRQAPKFAPR